MPHPSKLKYTQLFNSHDRNKRGTLTGKWILILSSARSIIFCKTHIVISLSVLDSKSPGIVFIVLPNSHMRFFHHQDCQEIKISSHFLGCNPKFSVFVYVFFISKVPALFLKQFGFKCCVNTALDFGFSSLVKVQLLILLQGRQACRPFHKLISQFVLLDIFPFMFELLAAKQCHQEV